MDVAGLQSYFTKMVCGADLAHGRQFADLCLESLQIFRKTHLEYAFAGKATHRLMDSSLASLAGLRMAAGNVPGRSKAWIGCF